ncbi:unnamed protein product, partial [Sphagnum jensenii]
KDKKEKVKSKDKDKKKLKEKKDDKKEKKDKEKKEEKKKEKKKEKRKPVGPQSSMFDNDSDGIRVSSREGDRRGSPDDLVLVSHRKESELQKLLAEERQRSEQRKLNYQALKGEHIKLQQDFLQLQSEMKLILEETMAMRETKDVEVRDVRKLLEERDKAIDSLKKELTEFDPMVIRERFEAELKEPLHKAEKEKQHLLREKEKADFEVKIHKQKIEHLEKEVVDA